MAKKLQAWSREFDSLIRAIGECKSKAEEDAIIMREMDVLKPRLKDPRVDSRQMKELMVRLIYVEMLGHDASWGHVNALRACSEKPMLTKKVAYLASTLFLDSNSDLIVLIVNTITRDLADDNMLIVCTALTAVCKLINADLITAVLAPVLKLLEHPKELVRKKAVMALHRFEQLDPLHEGPLSAADIDVHLRRMLCDKDPSVMAASLCALGELVARDARPYKNLIPSFVSILKQITDGKLPKAFDYHKVPAPFIQIKLLKLLGLLGAGDQGAAENMYGVIGAAMQKAALHGNTIGNAIVYEAARAITAIYPNANLLQSAAEIIATFLRAASHNLRYTGIDVLARMVRLNPKYAAEHQLAVIDCLEDPDPTLKKKTLELLFKMAKPNNVEVIVEKMVEYLRGVTDDVAKADVVQRISDLAERYAPDTQWFIDTMNQVFELGGDVVPPAMAANLTRLIAEGSGNGDAEADTAMQTEVVASYLDLLQKPKLSDVLLTVILWVLGEYGGLADIGPSGVLRALSSLAEEHTLSDPVRGYLLTAMAKLALQGGVALPPAAEQAVEDAAASRNTDLQQRALELQALLRAGPGTQQVALPPNASCEDIEIDPHLPFLNRFVQAALESGSAPYIPAEDRRSLGLVRASADDGHAAAAKPIIFKAYERPTLPAARQPLPALATQPMLATGGAPSGAASAAGASPAAAPAEPVLLRKAGGGRWGPAQATAPPPGPPPPSGAAGAPAHSGSSSVSSQPAAGAPPPPSARRRAESEEEAAARAEKERRAAALFGGGGGGPRSATPPRRPLHRVSPTRAPGVSAAAPPKQPQQEPDAMLLDLGGDAEQQPAQQPAAAAAPAGDLLAGLEGLDVSSAPAPQQAPVHGVPGLDDLMGGAQPQQDGGDIVGNGHGGTSHGNDLLGGLDAGHPAAQQPQPAVGQQQQYQQQQYQQPFASGGLPQYGAAAAAPGQKGVGASVGMRAMQQGPPPGQAKVDPFANLL